MYHDLRRGSICDKVFFAMVWVFYSMNAKYIQLPHSDLIRWAVMFLLLALSLPTAGKIRTFRFLTLFAAAVVPSLVNSVDRGTSIIKFFSMVAFFLSASTYFTGLRDREGMDRAFRLLLNVIVLYIFLDLFFVLRGDSVSGRLTGITTNANTLGIYCNLGMLACAYYKGRLTGIKRALVTIGLLCCPVMILLSASKTAFVTMFINAFLILRYENKRTRANIVFLLAAALAAVFLSGRQINLAIIARFREGFFNTRDTLWETGISIWKRYPIFGCGYTVSNLLNPGTDIWNYHMAFHNSYLSLLAETGVWGAAILGVSLFQELRKCLSTAREENRREQFSPYLIAFLMMLELLVAAASESFLFAIGSTEAFTFWTLFLWAMIYREKQTAADGEIPDGAETVTVKYARKEESYG